MVLHPSAEFLHILRATFETLEQRISLPEDERLLCEIKRVLLLRISELEALQTETTAPSPSAEVADGWSPES